MLVTWKLWWEIRKPCIPGLSHHPQSVYQHTTGSRLQSSSSFFVLGSWVKITFIVIEVESPKVGNFKKNVNLGDKSDLYILTGLHFLSKPIVHESCEALCTRVHAQTFWLALRRGASSVPSQRCWLQSYHYIRDGCWNSRTRWVFPDSAFHLDMKRVEHRTRGRYKDKE